MVGVGLARWKCVLIGNGKGVYKFTRTLLKFFSDFFLRIFDGPFFGVRGNRRQEKRACDRERPSCMVYLFVKDARMGLGHSLWVFAGYPCIAKRHSNNLLLFVGGQWLTPSPLSTCMYVIINFNDYWYSLTITHTTWKTKPRPPTRPNNTSC